MYQHYFPPRYPPLAAPDWDNLKSSVRFWLNVYRVDDFIGTFIDPFRAGSVDVPENLPISAVGHTGYWRQRQVLDILLNKGVVPGQPAPQTPASTGTSRGTGAVS